jgi:hypothetical protein
MDRRDALKKLGMGGAAVVGASAVMTSPAFADGGSVACRSTPNLPTTLSAVVNIKAAVAISTTRTTFAAAGCGCGDYTATAQRRWEATAAGGTPVGIYTAATAGTLLSPNFGTASTSVTIPSTVYMRKTAGGNLGADNYTVDLTVRHLCRRAAAPARVSWSCQRYRVTFAWNTSGQDGTITTSTSSTIGPPDTTDACNAPAPTP